MPKSRINLQNECNSNHFRTKASYFLSACFISQVFFYTQPLPGVALGIPLLSNKHSEMSLPTYEKLLQGAGPATNDKSTQTDSPSNQDGNSGTGNIDQSSNLSPLTLTDSAESKNNEAGTAGDTANGAVLKSTVTTTDYVPHQGDPDVLGARSISNKKPHKHKKNDHSDESWSQQAAEVKVGPLPLLESDGETQKKVDTVHDAELAQVGDLWEATLTHNPDIQFVIQKLQPTSNPAHLANILARMLSTVAYGGLGAMSMMSPNMGTFAAASMGGSMMQTALGITQSKSDKRAKLTNEEQTIMYNMVRNTCDKLVSCYRAYKKYWNSLTRASSDLQDLQAMVAESRAGQDSAKQLEMEYTLRKQQRDLDSIADDLRGHRQSLVDLAGTEAVEKLDKQLAEEHNKLEATNIPGGEQPGQTIEQQPNLNPLLKTNGGLAQSDTTIKNIDSADTFAAEKFASEKRKNQTASTLCPQS